MLYVCARQHNVADKSLVVPAPPFHGLLSGAPQCSAMPAVHNNVMLLFVAIALGYLETVCHSVELIVPICGPNDAQQRVCPPPPRQCSLLLGGVGTPQFVATIVQ